MPDQREMVHPMAWPCAAGEWFYGSIEEYRRAMTEADRRAMLAVYRVAARSIGMVHSLAYAGPQAREDVRIAALCRRWRPANMLAEALHERDHETLRLWLAGRALHLPSIPIVWQHPQTARDLTAVSTDVLARISALADLPSVALADLPSVALADLPSIPIGLLDE